MYLRKLFSFLVFFTAVATQAAEPGGPAEFKELKFRSIGPFAGGRTCRSAGVPGDPLTYYTATAAGGIWKSSDGGTHWKPVFDDQTIASVGSIAVAPSDPNVLYAGSGEANIRGNVAGGNGIYKSVDAGKTWKHVWKQTGQIGQMIVHPTNPDIAFAAVLGRAFGPNPERGIYRTSDGGKSWKQVLAKNADTGACDVCCDPNNPNILFAGLWQVRRRPWDFSSGGPGSGLYLSRDGGDSWKQLGGAGVPSEQLHGLPEGIYGKIGVAAARSDSRRVYALIEAEKGGLYRSDDGGDNWKLVNPRRYLRQRQWYFGTITVHPTNADVIYAPSVRLLKSIDGGKSFKQVKGPHHGDHHDLWIDPKNPKRIIDSNDGGVDISVNGGETWYAPPLPLGQFYHIITDNRVPYHVMGAIQDIGTAAGPSNSLSTAGITRSDWYSVGGGEAGFIAPDPSDPNTVYAGEYGGYISRFNYKTRQARNVSIYPTNASGHGAEELRYRFQWTAPILVSPRDPKVVYHAANVLFRTADAGLTWKVISPDLTRNDKSKQKFSGGPITGDNTGVEIYDTIFAIADSPRQKGLLWAGSDDGLVHVSRNGGKTWNNVTKNVPGLPEWATVACIEPGHFDDGTAYLVVDAHRLDDNRPYLWKTADFGKSWKSLAAKLPADVYLHAVREDPKRRGQLYLGSERGVRYSRDDGATWQELRLNLPTVPVHDLVVKDNDLVVGTHGRSVWIFDDLTPLREFSAPIGEKNAHLFPALPTVRWRYHSPVYSTAEKTAGQNPPKGASFDYFLKAKPKAPIQLEIVDAAGKVVHAFNSKEKKATEAEDHPDANEDHHKKPVLPARVGVNRFVWHLRYQGAKPIPGSKIDGGNPLAGPPVLPGTYTLRLTVDGQTLTTPVLVQPDPRVEERPAALEEQLKQALTLRDDISRLSEMVKRLRSVRTQLVRRNLLLADQVKAKPLIEQSKQLIAKLDALEEKLHNPKAEVSYDILAMKGGARLYSRMISLYEWFHDGDGPLTQGMKEVYAEQADELKKYAAELQVMLTGDVVKLNEQARKLEVPGVIVPGGRPSD